MADYRNISQQYAQGASQACILFAVRLLHCDLD